jgi:thioredoxin 1
MAGNVNELQDASFEEKVLKSDKPVFIDFWATWCQPCKAIAPIVEELAGEYAGKIEFFKVDTDRNKQYAAKFGVRGIPTLILFKGGQPVGSLVGAHPKTNITELLKKAL